MPHSMTGFAASEVSVGSHKLVWEIRSVNHRYLDLGFRLPEDFRPLEPKLRNLAAEAVKRGKVDCTLKVSSIGSDQAQSDIDQGQLAALKNLEAKILDDWPAAGRFTASEILRWPGVLKEDATPREALADPALLAFGEALTALRSAREREGNRLGEMLSERLSAIEVLMTAIDGQLKDAAPRYRDKLLERLPSSTSRRIPKDLNKSWR